MDMSSSTEVLKRLDSIYKEVKELSAEVIRLRVVNESHKEVSSKNTADIEILKADAQVLKGGLGVIRLMITLCCSSLLAFLAWLVISYISTQGQISDIKQRVALLESATKSVEHKHP